MLSFGFLLRLLPFFHHTHASAVYIRMLHAIHHIIYLFDLFYFYILLSKFFFKPIGRFGCGAIPGFQYNYEHTPPSIYVYIIVGWAFFHSSSRNLCFFFACLLAYCHCVDIISSGQSVCKCKYVLARHCYYWAVKRPSKFS